MCKCEKERIEMLNGEECNCGCEECNCNHEEGNTVDEIVDEATTKDTLEDVMAELAKQALSGKIEESQSIDLQATIDNCIRVPKRQLNVNPVNEPLFYICDTIPVYLNSAHLHMVGGVIAAITLGAHDGRPMILVDDMFLSLSIKAKTFTLLHELGHYQNGDFMVKVKGKINIAKEIAQILKSLFVKRYAFKETAADLYAAEKMNSQQDAISAMEEINDVLRKMTNIPDTDEGITDKKKLRALKKARKAFKKSEAMWELRMRDLKDQFINGPYFIDEDETNYSSKIVYKEIDEEAEEDKTVDNVETLNEVEEEVEEKEIEDKNNDFNIVLNTISKSTDDVTVKVAISMFRSIFMNDETLNLATIIDNNKLLIRDTLDEIEDQSTDIIELKEMLDDPNNYSSEIIADNIVTYYKNTAAEVLSKIIGLDHSAVFDKFIDEDEDEEEYDNEVYPIGFDEVPDEEEVMSIDAIEAIAESELDNIEINEADRDYKEYDEIIDRCIDNSFPYIENIKKTEIEENDYSEYDKDEYKEIEE